MIIEKNGKQIQYIVIPKPIKNAYFRIKNEQLIVTKGPRIPLQVIEKRIYDHFDQFYTLLEKPVTDESTLMIFGKSYPLDLVIGERFSYDITERITIRLPSLEVKAKAIQTFYGYELKRQLDALTPWLIEALKPFGLAPLPTKIKYLKSKFGSCHTKKKEITMNAYLARLDVIYTKYVLLHEYAHLIVPNHQKPFYDVLDQMMPGHRDIQKALRKHHI